MTILNRMPTWFQDHRLPAGARLAGLAALTQTFDVAAPVRRPACVSPQHVRGGLKEAMPWRIFDKRYEPGDRIGDHLVFAMRHDDLDLAVLKRVLEAIPTSDLESLVRSTPTGVAHRRVWFLYEHLLGRRLNVPDAPRASAVDLLDPTRYVTVPGEISSRHRVRNNLLGTPSFCPIIRRTETIQTFQARDLSRQAHHALGRVSSHMIMRAASFMLLADSKASFAIEGERPPRNRLERWGRAVLEAGRRPLDMEELEQLHRTLIGDDRFVTVGLRRDGVFLGERDRDGEPLPEFIGAPPEHLTELMAGFFACNDRMKNHDLDAVLQAAALAFGFVYVHPLEDGNGRIHRCLIHQVLADRQFTPPGVVFPVSSVIAERIDAYRQTLRAHSAPLMPYIDWRPTPQGNVAIANDPTDLYRYFDCTDNAEFLYGCVAQTVEHDLPHELDYLQRHDQALNELMDHVAISDRQANDVILFVRQNGGKFPQRRREGPFAKLTDDEVRGMEAIVNRHFQGFDSPTG
ncbi:MAG: Fic family protein [Candidatus Sericytochromatia bacterium]